MGVSLTASSLSLFPPGSILTSDFFGLCFGLGLFGYSPYWLYVRRSSLFLLSPR